MTIPETSLTNSQIVTPGSGTSSNIIGTNVLLNANIDMQQAFLNMLADISAEVAAFAKFQNLASQQVNNENFFYFEKYMQPVIDDENKGGPDWTPSGPDKLNMENYQTKTQENNAEGQAINQSVSTDSSAGTNLMQGVQGDSSNFTTMVGDTIDTALATMRLQ
jgi:hypothetical protein